MSLNEARQIEGLAAGRTAALHAMRRRFILISREADFILLTRVEVQRPVRQISAACQSARRSACIYPIGLSPVDCAE